MSYKEAPPETRTMIDGVKISYEKPPIFDAVCNTFQINPECYFTYGDTLYNPSRLPIPPEIIAHEKVHMKQQNYNDNDAAIWWGKFLRDRDFRIDQEARAYGRQYEYIKYHVKDKRVTENYLDQLTKSLSGPLYGRCIEFDKARKLIKKYS